MWQASAHPFTSRTRTFLRGLRAASARCGLEITHDAHGDGGSVDPRGRSRGAGGPGEFAHADHGESVGIGPLNLNTANASQLETLPGIGKSTAERILEYREKSGGFKKVEDLMNVRGIGEKSFLKLKPLVTVSSAEERKRRTVDECATGGPRGTRGVRGQPSASALGFTVLDSCLRSHRCACCGGRDSADDLNHRTLARLRPPRGICAARMALARAQAVSRSTTIALRFEAGPSGITISVIQDGNGNGVRTRDIDLQIDRPI